MHKAVAFALFLPVLLLTSCEKPVEQVQEAVRGDFKTEVRWQIYESSNTRNVDVCVARSNSRVAPNPDNHQCFFHGFDFSNVSAKWLADDLIEVTMSCGYLDHFANNALIQDATVPPEFHILLREDCPRLSARAAAALSVEKTTAPVPDPQQQ